MQTFTLLFITNHNIRTESVFVKQAQRSISSLEQTGAHYMILKILFMLMSGLDVTEV